MWHSRDLRSVCNLPSQTLRMEYRLYEHHANTCCGASACTHAWEFRVPATPISIGVTGARLSCFRDSRAWRAWRSLPGAYGISRVPGHPGVIEISSRHVSPLRSSGDIRIQTDPYRSFINKLFIARVRVSTSLPCATLSNETGRCFRKSCRYRRSYGLLPLVPDATRDRPLTKVHRLYLVRCGHRMILEKYIFVADKIAAVWGWLKTTLMEHVNIINRLIITGLEIVALRLS